MPNNWLQIQACAVACMWLVLGVSDMNADPVHAIVAGRVVGPDGSMLPASAVVISNGRIEEIVPAKELSGSGRVRRFPNAVLCPGLIDVRSSIGAMGSNIESAKAIDPGASAVDVIDWSHRDFRLALKAGVTTAVLAPAANNLVSGVAVAVKTAGVDTSTRVIRNDGPLAFALGSSVFEVDRAPTSRTGALAMLRGEMGRAKQGISHSRLNAFVNGKLDAMIVCEQAMDVSAALRTLGAYGGSVNFIHTSDVLDLSEELAGTGHGIVVGPYTFEMGSRVLSGAGRFSNASVPVAFAGDMPAASRDSLRMTAALAVKYGMEPGKARLAMTSAAATVAGIANRVGAIKPGMDADLVVFSDDPLRLDARVLEVYVGGQRVYWDDGNR